MGLAARTIHAAKNQFSLLCEIPMTWKSRVQMIDLSSLIKNPMFAGKVHLAVVGRVGVFIY